MKGKMLGHYRILDLIGQGSTGVVYRARDTQLERIVAIKVLGASLSDGGDFQDRLLNEARSAAKLAHPHIATIHDAGREAEIRFIVMEYIEGGTLRDSLNREGRLSPIRAMEVAIQIGRGLVHAHQRKVVHGDLKPGNLLVTAEGTVKVADFGLAKPLERLSTTEDGKIAGTVAYLAPERIEGKTEDERVDLYALGAVLYELLTGHPPFTGASVGEIIQGHLHKQPSSLQEIIPDVPDDLERVVMKLLEKNPGHRYRSAKELLKGLEALRDKVDAEISGPASDTQTEVQLVGREQELNALRAAVDQAHSGIGSVVFIEGEAGIGKTRLLTELTACKTIHKGEVFGIQCMEGATPYHGFVQLLMGILKIEDADTDAQCGEKWQHFVQTLEPRRIESISILERVLISSTQAMREDEALREEATSRQRLFWAVWQCLAAVAEQKPLILLCRL